MLRRLAHIFILSIILVFSLYPGKAHAKPQVLETWVDYNFGQQILFNARIESDKPIETAIVFFQAIHDSNTIIGLATVNALDNQIYEIQYAHQLSDYTIQAFSRIEYHFEITFPAKEILETTTDIFYYEDNRFEWDTLEENLFKVHWYQGDLQFAQNVLDTAQAGLEQIQNFLPLPAPPSLDIYIYPDTTSMQVVLAPNSRDWVAGHADPDLGVIVIELPDTPDQQLLMKQRIPHELMHILLFQSTNPGYENIPTWLNEGLATNAEIYPNPDYRIALKNAIEGDNLIPMSSLCNTFPRNNSDAMLSYAQSFSFTNYLYRTYGTSGLEELVTAYANGMDCERGAEVALGTKLTELDRSWQHQILSENPVRDLVNNITPWFFLLLVLFIAPGALLIQKAYKRHHQQTTRHSSG